MEEILKSSDTVNIKRLFYELPKLFDVGTHAIKKQIDLLTDLDMIKNKGGDLSWIK